MSYHIPVTGYSDNAILFAARMYFFLRAAKSLVCVTQLAGKVGDLITPTIPFVEKYVTPFFSRVETWYPSCLRVTATKNTDDSNDTQLSSTSTEKNKEWIETKNLMKLAIRHGAFAIGGLAALECFVKEPSNWYNIVLSRISPFLINPKFIASLLGRVTTLTIPLTR